jgi:acetylglutamate kinase
MSTSTPNTAPEPSSVEADLTASLLEALPYISHYAGKIIVVKIGGSTLSSDDTILQDIVLLKRLQIAPVLVHGGGSMISDWLRKIDKKSRFVDGLRVTDDETMDVVKMVLAGKVNGELVAMINQLGGQAVGLSGWDARLLGARKHTRHADIGLVGEVTSINLDLLHRMIEGGFIPVIAPIGLASDGQALNINADTAAAAVGRALHADKLVFLTDVCGVCDANGQLIPRITTKQVDGLISSGVISGGMIPKIEACVKALDGVKRTHIIDGRLPRALIREMFTQKGIGTMITREDGEETELDLDNWEDPARSVFTL